MVTAAFRGRRRIALAAVLVLLVIIAALVASAAWRHYIHRNEIAASGTIEITEASLAPKVQGRLIALRVSDGDIVRKGATLAVLEQTVPALGTEQAQAVLAAATAQQVAAQAAYDLQREQYASTVAQASAGVAVAHSSVGQANETLTIERRAAVLGVDQARAQLESAKANLAKASTDLSRAASLVSTGDEPQQHLDDAQAAYVAAQTQERASSDALQLAQADVRTVAIREFALAGARSQHAQTLASLDSAKSEAALVDQRHAELLATQADVAQARAQLALARNQVHETRVIAPFDGAVISHDAEIGDLIQPGSGFITIGNIANPYVYVYVSETQLPLIKTGMDADVRIDGLRSRVFHGRVTEIADQAEFTPQNVQTTQDRIEYLVFRVKIQLHDETGTLKAGLPVDAVIHT